MSAIRVFDVPHIFRYGRVDEEKGETWQFFYRNATGFSVDVKRADVAGTAFEAEWSKYCVEHRNPKGFKDRWHDFCDFTIGELLPTLKELAPQEGGHQWISLEDYIRTPHYKLQFFRDASSKDAIAKVMQGPTIKPSFSMQPISFSDLDLPADFRQITAADLIVLNRESDLRQRPETVRVSSTGEVAFLLSVENPVQAVETGITSRPSVERIVSTLALRSITEPVNIPRPKAIVTTTGTSSSDLLIAGLLCTKIPHTAHNLADKRTLTLATDDAVAMWRKQTTILLNTLHSHGIVHGSINRWSILVDHSTNDVWLTAPNASGCSVENAQDSSSGPEKDWNLLDYTFEEWLPQELSRVGGTTQAI